jgi:hypothetical protein
MSPYSVNKYFDPDSIESLISDPSPRAVAVLIMASYAYYVRTEPVSLLSDDQFDRLMGSVGQSWDKVKSHQHADLLRSRADFAAGSVYRLTWVPDRVIGAAETMIAKASS